MRSLQEYLNEFYGAVARYCAALQHHLLMVQEFGMAAQRTTGSAAYRQADWAFQDVDNAATKLDEAGREVVAILAKRLQDRIIYDSATYTITEHSIEQATPDGQKIIFWADKTMEHPALAATPMDWVNLAPELPVLQEALGETPVS